MKYREFIVRNSSPVEFWDGYDGKLIAKADAEEAAKIAYNEAIADVISLVEKYTGISVQFADVLQRDTLKLKKEI